MTDFKTRAEIVAAAEIIQLFELLRSGSLGSGIGINRALERLAENLNGVMETLQMTKGPRIAGGGNISFGVGVANQLAWDNAIYVFVASELTGCQWNAIQPTHSPQVIPPFSVMYIVVDRGAPSVNVVPVIDTYANFFAAVANQPNRLDYVLIAFSGGDSLLMADGHTIRSGFSLDDGLSLDNQYGQQSEVTLIRSNQKENLKLFITNGGTISWDSAAGTLVLSDDLYIEFPSSAGRNRVVAGTYTVASGRFWYVTLTRTPPGVVNVVPAAVLPGAVPTLDNTFVIGFHNPDDNRFYFWNGSALSDGESILLGGVRAGVQWFYQDVGLGTQVYDLTALVGPAAQYRVGSGELMVYRNGIKASASKSYWSGVYPAGALVGPGITTFDDYVEEDGTAGDLEGTRIIWLRETAVPNPDEALTGLYFVAATFPPGFAPTWPTATDMVEAFVGVQGNPPTISIPDGIYGFEMVWVDPNTIRCGGGTLVSTGTKFRNTGNPALTLTTADMFGVEVLAPDSWHYVYLGPGTTVGGDPDIKLSVQPPDNTTTGGAGTHPDDAAYKFLTSAYVDVSSNFTQFVKEGSRVIIGNNSPIEAGGAFAAAIGPGPVTVNLSPYLPQTGVMAVKLHIIVSTLPAPGIPAGNRVRMQAYQTGISVTDGAWTNLYAIKPGNDDNVEFDFDVPIPDGTFQINLPDTEYDVFVRAKVVEYTEGRQSSGSTLGA